MGVFCAFCDYYLESIMKKESQSSLRYLVNKYLEGKATPEEIRFLEMFYDSFDANPNVLDLLDQEEAERLGDRIRQRVSLKINNPERKTGKVLHLTTKWWLAAASVILLLGLGFWYVQMNSHKQEKVEVVQRDIQQEILPGGNRATLILADGSRVILDSASNGNIATQGNVNVIKLNDGRLAYDAQGEEAQVVYNTISTPRGGQYQVVLADGTKVWLNAASTLKFPSAFTQNERRVTLTGEGYFEVAQTGKPFFVDVEDMEVKVLGTHFNVNAYVDEGVIKTTLLEGKVEVTAAGEKAVLKPGQQAQLEPGMPILQIKTNVDVDEVTAWKNGLFYFRDADLPSVMKQLTKWYDVDVLYSGKIHERNFEGKMQRSLSLAQVLKILSKNNVNFEIVGRKIIVKP